jgi:hypothetical protein
MAVEIEDGPARRRAGLRVAEEPAVRKLDPIVSQGLT